MNKNIYFNWTILFTLVAGLGIFDIFAWYFLFPMFESPQWIIWGTYILGTIIGVLGLSLVSPFLLIITSTKNLANFIGFPWIFKIKKDKLERVSIITYGIAFLPKNGYYRYMMSSKNGRYKGWKIIKFPNLKGWGALIEFFNDMNPQIDINWDALNDEKEEYIREKLYGD